MACGTRVYKSFKKLHILVFRQDLAIQLLHRLGKIARQVVYYIISVGFSHTTFTQTRKDCQAGIISLYLERIQPYNFYIIRQVFSHTTFTSTRKDCQIGRILYYFDRIWQNNFYIDKERLLDMQHTILFIQDLAIKL